MHKQLKPQGTNIGYDLCIPCFTGQNKKYIYPKILQTKKKRAKATRSFN